ncbi:DUF4177 domain-containing protein [Candidatus Epulonipiscium viviparus]|uniref:DUF4177 domain-containing protein n=1 Tax=Candidatus Epulonipiscium viviparus TaxID=420336 RepID=UPI00016C04C4|nr:DUF4177 domain-containing protein [Candidatus Epulopiscium viviparus]
MKEYKLIRIKVSKEFVAEETLMNKMATEGWEVISVSPDAHTKVGLHLLITFAREK